MNNKLIDFLRRMPWASRELLENYFGVEDLEKNLLKDFNDKYYTEETHYKPNSLIGRT